MSGHILTLNAGSSSLKFALFDEAAVAVAGPAMVSGQLEGLGTHPRLTVQSADRERLADRKWEKGEAGCPAGVHDALRVALDWLDGRFGKLAVRAVGHRIVHGGVHYSAPMLIDEATFETLKSLVPLAPLHQPHNLEGVRAAITQFPGVPQVACFDTAFHRGHPFVHDAFALPREYYEQGVRRYGFHGLSYEYIAQRLPAVDPQAAAGRTVVAHLGSGASMCALHAGRSLASTMGFTALDGLPMGTRPGQIDPGVLLWLMDERGMDAKALSDLLYKRSGLKGLSGVSNDMRDLHASEVPAAREAVDYFVERLRREIGALAASLGGIDALVFTAGIGENDRIIRARACADMQWLGLDFDPEANEQLPRGSGGLVSAPGSRVRAWVIPTNEELMIARHAARLVVPAAREAAGAVH
jgi:acetate kinase